MTSKPNPFYDRTAELQALERAWTRPGGQMLLLYGRRRLGKTYLLQRYVTSGVSETEGAKPNCYYLAEQTTAVAQRSALARELLTVLPSEGVGESDIAVSWNALLRHVSQAAKGRFAVILDEFPYLVEQSPELPSTLQAWWDREGVHSSLMLVLCGSQLSVMASLGRESAPLFGRFNAGVFHLEPLSYKDVACFYGGRYGLSDTLLMYGVLGGTPRYHALVDTARSAREEILTLLMQPRAVLENEVRFLLGSEQIREPAPYNAVLAAIASGETQAGRIQNRIGVERGTLSFYLRTLQELGWIHRELPFGETSERRAIYRISDPFLAFWYRFVVPNASAFQFSDPQAVFADHVEPHLADYMGRFVFEDICMQWLRRHGPVRAQKCGRYWNRDSSVEIDLVGDLGENRLLFGECKWRSDGVMKLGDFSRLQAKVASLRWKEKPTYIMFTLGGFAPGLRHLAEDPAERLFLVSGQELLPSPME